MNSERDNQDDETDDVPFEAADEHAAREPARPSWLIRITQFALAVVFIGIVVHGLWTRSRHETAQTNGARTSVLDPTERGEQTTVTTAPSTPVANDRRSAEALPQAVSSVSDGLNSLYDIRDYLELSRVRRETRAYELGLTSRDALVQMALTAEPNR